MSTSAASPGYGALDHDTAVHRVDRRQVVEEQLPTVTVVSAIEELSGARTDINTAGVQAVGRHPLPHDVEVGAFLGQPLRQRLSVIPRVAASGDPELGVRDDAHEATDHFTYRLVLRDHVYRPWVAGVYPQRQAET